MCMLVTSVKIDHINGNINMLKDRFISHAVLILASQVVGITKIYNITYSDEIMLTIKALKSLDVQIKYEDGICIVQGVGIGGFTCSKSILYLNDPSIYMMVGSLSTCPFISFFDGDCHLNIDEIVKPLSLMGARFVSNNNRLPIALIGCIDMLPIEYIVDKDEIKTMLLFAALNVCGTNTIVNNTVDYDKITPILKHFNVSIECFTPKRHVSICGQQELYSKDIYIPSDFFCTLAVIAVALMVENSEIVILDVLLNDEIKSFYQILIKMGGNIFFINKRQNVLGAEIADLLVKSSILVGIDYLISEELSLDECLIIIVVSSYAHGITMLNGLLRRFIDKRLKNLINGLIKCGIRTEIEGDNLIIHGCSGNILGGVLIDACHDFKVAVMGLVLGMISDSFIEIKNIRKTSDFIAIVDFFNKHGAKITFA
ncbi:3-phosphoshikimate 1-carboxyvinyltransferase [Ehrlichia ruminantium]|nr:3-phosphoshikimate 1-carboxyvinyltransferase [Ehrlichia ruminantium]UOD98971.1 3-phosphoshikimate 1-carboxyvinyltransferase [Ehrlichia ruminantium]